ncbi:MAG: hypothetical protein Q8L37_07670 [Candidatus Gottesmanbacteria bacterium]|nr:hypothetical protein [Candidatus Gottesmanbacteria bacterium]
MYRNTYLLVSLLAVIAALLIGVNLGRKLTPATPSSSISFPTPTVLTTGQSIPSDVKPYRNSFCNVAFDYPASLRVLENASGSAAFTGNNPDDGILMTCQKNIPKPMVSESSIEDIRVGTTAAKLYHTQLATDSASVDSLIFRHPGTKLDVFLAGRGEAFRKLISSITLLP